jgi:hypothetical protein
VGLASDLLAKRGAFGKQNTLGGTIRTLAGVNSAGIVTLVNSQP